MRNIYLLLTISKLENVLYHSELVHILQKLKKVRYKKITANDRVNSLYNLVKVEDEYHFIFECHLHVYENERELHVFKKNNQIVH